MLSDVIRMSTIKLPPITFQFWRDSRLQLKMHAFSELVKRWYEEGGIMVIGYELFRIMLEHTTEKGKAKIVKRAAGKQDKVCVPAKT